MMLQVPVMVLLAFHIAFALSTAAGLGIEAAPECGRNIPGWVCYTPIDERVLAFLDSGVNITSIIAGGFGFFNSIWGMMTFGYDILKQEGIFGNLAVLIRIIFAFYTLLSIGASVIGIIGGIRRVV